VQDIASMSIGPPKQKPSEVDERILEILKAGDCIDVYKSPMQWCMGEVIDSNTSEARVQVHLLDGQQSLMNGSMADLLRKYVFQGRLLILC
jgi:hypothetical protein